MDILICKLIYPNDPTKTLVAHQHFVGFFDCNSIVLYSISSVLGKEYKVFYGGSKVNPLCFLLVGDLKNKCNLRADSFIDCSKSYRIELDNTININKLSCRNIPKDVREKQKKKEKPKKKKSKPNKKLKKKKRKRQKKKRKPKKKNKKKKTQILKKPTKN